jgi:hypothetical protein
MIIIFHTTLSRHFFGSCARAICSEKRPRRLIESCSCLRALRAPLPSWGKCLVTSGPQPLIFASIRDSAIPPEKIRAKIGRNKASWNWSHSGEDKQAIYESGLAITLHQKILKANRGCTALTWYFRALVLYALT